MLVDTHTHLNLSPLYEHWQEVLDRSEAAGVVPVIVPGASVESSRLAVEIAQKDGRVFAAVGIHPEELEKKNYDLPRRQAGLGFMIQELNELVNNKRVVAIGECGLDYYFRESQGVGELGRQAEEEIKQKQKLLFTAQVELAQELQLPLIIHTRTEEAMLDAVEILKNKQASKMVFHCFSGDLAFWQLIEPLGAYVGVGATITYPKNGSLRETITQIPMERIVMETDSPWLPPQNKRGQINEPSNVTIATAKVAEIKQIQLSKVLEITGNNTVRLFPKLKS